jgi:long-chain acyl-CoA synthetase
VVGLHRHYVAAGLQLYEWTKSAKRPWVDTIMLPLPLFHVYANVGVQPLAFLGPNPISLVPNPRDIDDLLKTIRQTRPAFFNGVPTLYTAILNHRDVRAGKVDLSSIKLCFSGSAALMAETKREFERLTGARIVEGYSLTEGMMACCVNPVRGTTSSGRLACRCPTSRCASSTLTIRSVKWAWTKSARCCCVHHSTWSSTGTIPRRRPRR